MLAHQALLVAVIAAHQHADLVVMVQAREGQLMPKTLLLGEIVQLAGDTPQRANHQPVDAPGERHSQHQHQK